MKLNEIITVESGFFAALQKADAGIYINFFGDTATSRYDNYIYNAYGNKTASPYLEANKDNLTTVMALIVTVNKQRWISLNNDLTASYNISTPYNVTETKTGTLSNEATNTNTNEESTKAFNSTDYVGKEKNANESITANTETYNITTETKGNRGINAIAIAQAHIELLQRKIFNIITYDIMNVCSLTVYE